MPIAHDELVRHLLADRAKLLAYIWVIVRDEHAAEDVFQEVSMLALHKRDEIEDAGHLMHWLRAAARNKSLHVLRDRRTAPSPIDDDVLEMMNPHFARHDTLDNLEVIDAIKHCKAQLAPNARRVIEARYRDGLTGPKLADRFGRSVNTVYQALTRAHRALADCIRKRLEVHRA